MGQDAVIQADDKDHAELQSLGGMQGEQGRHVSFTDRILIGDQGYVLQEFVERASCVFLSETSQLLDVLPAVRAFLRLVIDIRLEVEILEDAVEQLGGVQRQGGCAPAGQQSPEVRQRDGGTSGE